MTNPPTIIPLGHRCSTTGFIKELNYRTESYPFDWVISKLDTIQHCIETNFIEFINKSNYKLITCPSHNNLDGKIIPIQGGKECVLLNTFYQEQYPLESTYTLKLALVHHDIFADGYDYFQRCIERFKVKMNDSDKKILLYFHPYLGQIEYSKNEVSILESIVNFFNFIQAVYSNVYGLFFIIMQGKYTKLTILYTLPDITIYKLETNPDFIDRGTIWEGTCTDEFNIVSNIIRQRYNS
jgi:hypothetical protein